MEASLGTQANKMDYPEFADQWVDAEPPSSSTPKMEPDYFTENRGQWGDHIRYLARTSFGHVALGDNGIHYYLVLGGEGHSIKISFQNAQSTSPLGLEEVGFESNYFYGKDDTKWVTNVRSYDKVQYKDVWPGIDIIYYFKNGDLKYDILVQEYARTNDISFFVEGEYEMVVIDNELGIFVDETISIWDSGIVAYYSDGKDVPVAFKRTGVHTYGFQLNKIYGKALTIDPVVLSNSTYLGGTGGEYAYDTAIDSNDNIIILGSSSSLDFPNTTGAYQNSNNGCLDITITKLNEKAEGIIFSTYIGDYANEFPSNMDIDEAGNVYVTGITWSMFFPTTNGSFQDTDPSGTYPDIFVLKLSSTGDDLIYSTYVGGTKTEYQGDIKVREGKAYVSGNTYSYDFPSVGPPIMDAHGTLLFFILNEDGTNLTNSMFRGGFYAEYGDVLDIDDNGDVIIGGWTSSTDFPVTPGAYQTTVNDNVNGILIKYRPSVNTTIFATYIGGDGSDGVDSIYVDENMDIYISGRTGIPPDGGDPFPTTSGAFKRNIDGDSDIFISKMDKEGENLIYSTLVGGNGDEESGKMDVDDDKNVILTGKTTSFTRFYITVDCFDSTFDGESDSFFIIMNHNLSQPIYSTYLGGNLSDFGVACAINSADELIVLGYTESADYPITYGAFQSNYNGYQDMFITKFIRGDLMYLQEGWNLVSIPLKQTDLGLEDVLSSISGWYDSVQWFDANDLTDHWKHNHKLKNDVLNDLDKIDHKMGFWIHITLPGGVVFRYPGTQLYMSENIWIYKGWNLVGFPSGSCYKRDEGLNNLNFGNDVDCVQYYDARSGKMRSMGPDDSFVPGRGYWMHAKYGTMWGVPL
jgi:hypothetical protein